VTAFISPMLLAAYLSSVMTVAFLDGAGWLPVRVRQCVGPALVAPLNAYAETGGPGIDRFEQLCIKVYEHGYSLC
jgi:hypothetical protein